MPSIIARIRANNRVNSDCQSAVRYRSLCFWRPVTRGDKTMKQKNSIALSLFLLTTFVSSFFIQKYSEGSERLPAEMVSFYSGYNFVSSFSTPKERSGLISLSKLPPKDRPKKSLPKRLKKVQKIAKEIKSRIWSVDPGIAIFPRQPSDGIISAELVTVDNFNTTKDRLVVQVTVYSIEPKVNLILVSQYESYSGDESKIPSLQERFELFRTLTPRREIHHWIQMDGRWMLKEAKIVLL